MDPEVVKCVEGTMVFYTLYAFFVSGSRGETGHNCIAGSNRIPLFFSDALVKSR